MLSNRALDRASDIEQADRDKAIRDVRARVRSGPSSEVCQDETCGEPIPEARRLAVPGCRYCIDCQVRLEQHCSRRRNG
ncbi:TraR/DksA C4-type zinc finger protein [Cupriavidus taiwanensis]|uniref:TraR/DksA C4-type zinc finger protein n=1 Tax=Cupriavidus taiwanensis TaxID=164546 RepID=UPI000472056F|nr:TraR/DksA C4-type zinc finger protein [Cupriavidus taiwanensis]SOZ12069.1 Transcriptional regulator, TraR/DksA family protein [Cupriavidus taiwanensis]